MIGVKALDCFFCSVRFQFDNLIVVRRWYERYCENHDSYPPGEPCRAKGVRKTLVFVQLGGDRFPLSLATGNRQFCDNSFRTAVSVGIECRHSRDTKFLSDCPPGQTFHVTETYNFITPENPLRTPDDLPGRLRRTDAG
jgi:hypothetical protein